MKVVENMILNEIFRVVSRFPRYILCYVAENRFPLGQCSDRFALGGLDWDTFLTARNLEYLLVDLRISQFSCDKFDISNFLHFSPAKFSLFDAQLWLCEYTVYNYCIHLVRFAMNEFLLWISWDYPCKYLSSITTYSKSDPALKGPGSATTLINSVWFYSKRRSQRGEHAQPHHCQGMIPTL